MAQDRDGRTPGDLAFFWSALQSWELLKEKTPNHFSTEDSAVFGTAEKVNVFGGNPLKRYDTTLFRLRSLLTKLALFAECRNSVPTRTPNSPKSSHAPRQNTSSSHPRTLSWVWITRRSVIC